MQPQQPAVHGVLQDVTDGRGPELHPVGKYSAASTQNQMKWVQTCALLLLCVMCAQPERKETLHDLMRMAAEDDCRGASGAGHARQCACAHACNAMQRI